MKGRTIKWTGWQAQDDEQEEKFKKMVLQKGDEESVKSLPTIQENIESAAHTTQKGRDSKKKRLIRLSDVRDQLNEWSPGFKQKKPERNT